MGTLKPEISGDNDDIITAGLGDTLHSDIIFGGLGYDVARQRSGGARAVWSRSERRSPGAARPPEKQPAHPRRSGAGPGEDSDSRRGVTRAARSVCRAPGPATPTPKSRALPGRCTNWVPPPGSPDLPKPQLVRPSSTGFADAK
jgi:hypothetical protein